MLFHLCFFIFIFIAPISTLINCPKCITNIGLTQLIEIPIDCVFVASDYCTTNVKLDYNASIVQVDFDGKMELSSNGTLFNTSVSYTSYFHLDQSNIVINMDIKCSFEDRCAYHIAQRQVEKIINETTPFSVWTDIIGKLTEITLAAPGAVSLEQCYKPNDAIEKCPLNSNICNVEHIFPLEKQPDLSFKSHRQSGSSKWRAGCFNDATAPFTLTLGYSFTQPSDKQHPDTIVFSLNCDKTLCNGGSSRENVIQLLKTYPTLAAWYTFEKNKAMVQCSLKKLSFLMTFVLFIRMICFF